MKVKTPTSADFTRQLYFVLKNAQRLRASYVGVSARNLHIAVGGYPNRDNRMPLCCAVMRRAKKPGDKILKSPRSGMGASLTILYRLPR